MRGLAVLFALYTLSSSPANAADAPKAIANPAHLEARPFDEKADAKAQVDAAIRRAYDQDKGVIVVFGANWCHDSRALAGWFATDRFKTMLGERYEIVWVDVGQKDKNLDLARRFGLDGISGTPTVLVLDGAGNPLNIKDAPKWRNASTRSEASIYRYFENTKGMK